MSKGLIWALGVVLTCATPTISQVRGQQSARTGSEDLGDLHSRLTAQQGDIDEMNKLRIVRALVSFNKASLFFDHGGPSGLTDEALMQMKGLFQKYANQYQFPWILIAAEAYQESGLNQDAKSARGAIGVMQVMPTTAASPPVSIPDVTELEPNIKAGVKLLKYIRDDYFKDDPMDPLNKMLVTLAAYNAGPARLKQCRQLAADMGLNPNIWFKNVEYAVAKKVGTETVTYVSNIYEYYLGWRLVTEREAARTRLQQTQKATQIADSKN